MPAPNPIMIPRKPVPNPALRHRRTPHPRDRDRFGPAITATFLVTAACVLLYLVVQVKWIRRWFVSGAAIESLLLLYASGRPEPDTILPRMPLWAKLSTLNLIYAVCSTSWLLHGIFTVACFPAALLTSLVYFPTVGYFLRRVLRKTLGKHPQFVTDRLALFDLPALEIDTEVDGLLVIRGVTIYLSTFTIIAHGIEVGIKITKDIELAIYVDQVTVALFRRFDIGHVFANVKGGKFEMTFGGIDEDTVDDDSISVDSIFLSDTPLLRAASAGLHGFEDRKPSSRGTQGRPPITSKNSNMQDSSARDGFHSVTKLSPDDELAEHLYLQMLEEIETTSSIHQSTERVKRRLKGTADEMLIDEKALRAAISQELHTMPSVAHPPSRSVRVTTLQNSSPPYVRRFMHRLPFLLRLLLAPLSYFHSIHIESINAGGSGHWVAELLQQEVFKSHLENSAELRRLHRRVSAWLENATFCLQLTDVKGLASVPLSTIFDINAWLKFNDVMAYRAEQQSTVITQVVRLGGADATFTIPSFLLPHHEHLIPPKPTASDTEELRNKVRDADGIPKTTQAKKDLDLAEKDECTIDMSVHASLPVSVDQTLLNFTAALVKATKMIELEKEVAHEEPHGPDLSRVNTEPPSLNAVVDGIQLSRSTTQDTDDVSSIESLTTRHTFGGPEKSAKVKSIARNIRQNLKDGSYNTSIKEFARELRQNTKDGMRKAAVGGLVNDRWIAKLVGKTAVALQKTQGDVGYSGSIPVPLAPYRGDDENLAAKILP